MRVLPNLTGMEATTRPRLHPRPFGHEFRASGKSMPSSYHIGTAEASGCTPATGPPCPAPPRKAVHGSPPPAYTFIFLRAAATFFISSRASLLSLINASAASALS